MSISAVAVANGLCLCCLQIVGAPFAELKVLALERDYERETEWHKRHPTLNPA